MSQNIIKFVINTKRTLMLFNQIYTQYYKKIYQFVYRLSYSQQDSEDITQDVFISLFKEIESNNKLNNIKAWLYKCAFNKFINVNKKSKVISLTNNISHYEINDQASIESDFIHNEKKKIIIDAMSKLTEQEQVLLNLYNEDFSYKEISEIVDIKYTSVGKILSRVIEKLAKQIKLSNHEELCIQRKIV